MDSLTFSVCKQCEYLGLAANSNAPFCVDPMECLDFFSSGRGGEGGGLVHYP